MFLRKFPNNLLSLNHGQKQHGDGLEGVSKGSQASVAAKGPHDASVGLFREMTETFDGVSLLQGRGKGFSLVLGVKFFHRKLQSNALGGLVSNGGNILV